MAKIAVAGSKTTTFECLRELIRDGFHIDLLVTLTPEQAEASAVAGYMDLRPFAEEHGIRIYHPQIYTLKDDRDRESLLSEGVDALLVIGWQRLIPEWWLNALTFGAFGMHGSPEPLPRGRGRSPLNWSLLQGRTSFMTHLFRYDANVDSGAVVGMQKFDINAWDDPDTLHMKNRIAMNRLLRKHLPEILAGTAEYVPQSSEIEPTYYPERTEEDGRVVWDDMDMVRLYNHIRCQTHPFPGAFSHLNGAEERFYFWRAHPFDGHLIYYGSLPGTVVEVFYDGSFLLATWDGSVRVSQYTAPNGQVPAVGDRFYNHPISRGSTDF